jgi:methionine-rich copper-binding protein CopC
MAATLQEEPLDARLRPMIGRRMTVLALAGVGMLAASVAARADDLRVLETHPAASSIMDGRSDGFFVRFNQPIDHVNSQLVIKRGADVVETLQPRLQSNPNVLFARAPGLPDGQYVLHWYVKTLAGAKVEQGEVPFSVTTPK